MPARVALSPASPFGSNELRRSALLSMWHRRMYRGEDLRDPRLRRSCSSLFPQGGRIPADRCEAVDGWARPHRLAPQRVTSTSQTRATKAPPPFLAHRLHESRYSCGGNALAQTADVRLAGRSRPRHAVPSPSERDGLRRVHAVSDGGTRVRNCISLSQVDVTVHS